MKKHRRFQGTSYVSYTSPAAFHNTSAVNFLPHQLHPQYSHINVTYIVGTELRVKSQTCKTKESVDWSY